MFLIPIWAKPQKMAWRVWPALLGLGYVWTVKVLGGLRPDHVLVGFLFVLDYYNEHTRRFLKYFFPFLLTAIVYDSMRYFYWEGVRGHIHVREPYLRDLSWFGIGIKDGTEMRRLTPNEYFQLHHNHYYDFVCGFAYLTFVGEYLLPAVYLFVKNKLHTLRVFGWSFFTVNILGYVTYYIYPAAPPWYINKYGLGDAKMRIPAGVGAAGRFDDLLGTHFFQEMYGRGVDVYGAYPSLHVAYPLLVLWMTLKIDPLKVWRVPALFFYFLMCFSAVYLQHHFIVDLLLGTLYAIVVAVVADSLVKTT